MGPDSVILAIVELTVTFITVTILGIAVRLTQLEAVFAAAVVATTSKAIMSKILLETKSLRANESHTVVTASIIEDFATVFMLLLLPGLAAASNQVPPQDIIFLALKGALLVGIIFFFGWRIAPWLIERISKADQEYKETAFLLALSFGFAFALLSSYLGFSPAVGAFLMGLMIRVPQAQFVNEKVIPINDLSIVL